MRALLSPGDVVVYTAPAYQSLYEVARAVGCEMAPWRPRFTPLGDSGQAPSASFAAADLRLLLDSLAAAGPRGRKLLVVLNLPHNPTGATLTPAEFEGVIEGGAGAAGGGEGGLGLRASGGTLRTSGPGSAGALQAGAGTHSAAGSGGGSLSSIVEDRAAESVVDVCRRYGAYLFVDEMYRGLEHAGVPTSTTAAVAAPGAELRGGATSERLHATPVEACLLPSQSRPETSPHAPAARRKPPDTSPRLRAACDAYERGVSLCGLSKTIGLPGLRIGWLATRHTPLLARVAELKDYVSVCPPAPSEALARIALRHYAQLLQRSSLLLQHNLAAVGRFTERHEGQVRLVSQPQGGTFCLVRIDGERGCRSPADEVSASAYAEALRSRARLMLLPSALFGLRDDALRLTYGRRGTPALLERWSADLDQHGFRGCR
jgi:aspartate/methionine/tyrosine aminotransferase